MDKPKAIVVYDSLYGNTRQVAEAVGGTLAERFDVAVQNVAAAQNVAIAPDIALMVVGSPTHRHGASAGIQTFLDRFPRRSLQGVQAAAFDTRYPGPVWITGSAAGRIARVLRRAGAGLLADPESFLIAMDTPPEGEKRRHELERLQDGELERVVQWAQRLLDVLAATPAVAPLR